ncbi:MAG: putative rane protein [Bradyrhizobium sp.]|nr:putative rane protein [Bradyrhizobium sp.]
MTMHAPIYSAFYAALLALLSVLLTVRVIVLRGRFRVGEGDGGQVSLQRAIRAHANFTEQAPLALLLIVLAEGLGALPLVIHVLGLVLLIGRLSSAWQLSRTLDGGALRGVGAGATLLAVLAAAVVVLYRVSVAMSLQ